MKQLLLISTLLLSISSLRSQTTWGVQFSNAIISRYQPTINAMTDKGWEYSNSIILHGMEKIYAKTQTPAYLNYITAYVDTYVSSTGAVSGLAVSLDKIHPGLLCLFLYEKTGNVKYKTAAINIRNYILSTSFKKTPNGGYWHKVNGSYDNVMMVDGLYMAHPFLAKYGALFNDTTCLTVVSFQPLLLGSFVMPSGSNLPKHAYDYSKTKPWANASTGVSSEVWSRGTGWYVMALVDILSYLPSTHRNYAPLLALFQRMAVGIKASQDSTTGLWYQVMDKGTLAGNYLKSSGSGMFVYALKKGVDKGWLTSATYLPVAQKGWAGLQTRIVNNTDGKPQINSFAPAMSVQNTYTDYINIKGVNCPSTASTQHPHGYCGVLMAAAAMEFGTITKAATPQNIYETTAAGKTQLPAAYPIPFTTDLYVQLPAGKQPRKEIQVRNSNGTIVARKIIDGMDESTYHLTLQPHLAKGLYLLYVVENGKTDFIQKLVKK